MASLKTSHAWHNSARPITKLDLNSLPLTPSCTTQQALADGEDYELLFTLPPSLASDLQNSGPHTSPHSPKSDI
ncbi:hypothetical protein [Rubritalea tangerina]|uniref:hypothetical protein n=1 Tax=Rubritalea tangerina TaxID=430798 RepID=UPI0036185669